MNKNLENKGVRLHKFLSERGVASRRKCEEYIAEGLVKVNGEVVTKMGIKVDPKKDKILFEDRLIAKSKEEPRTIILYKPKDYVCTLSEKEGKSVYRLIRNIKERLVPIGRLDKYSEGILLMSNDGELVNYLTHPRFGQEKVYEVIVSGNFVDATLSKLRSRMTIDDYQIQPARVNLLKTFGKLNQFLLEFTLKEGRSRQIRKMCEQARLKVRSLTRVRVKNLTLDFMKVGQWRDLTTKELKGLKK
ncbi:MAG: rRNA pseudouridine synthase [Candidatus Aenigmarchaeota archaeon]|nr:rRNA pseudouridine synthase [Candidatus Aenigmarchaeota archaeon]